MSPCNCAGRDTELCKDVLQVVADSVVRDEQLLPDLAIGHALGGHPGNLELPRGELALAASGRRDPVSPDARSSRLAIYAWLARSSTSRASPAVRSGRAIRRRLRSHLLYQA